MIAGDGPLRLFKLDRGGLFIDKPRGQSDAVDNRLRAGGAARDIEVNRNDFLDRADNIVGIVPKTAAAGARANSENQFRGRHGLIRALQSLDGGAERRSLTQHGIRVPRGTNQFDAKAFGVIIGGQDVEYFNVAPITAAAIDMIDPERTTEHFLAQTF